MKNTLSEKEKEIERLRTQLKNSKDTLGTDSDVERSKVLEKKLKTLEKENRELGKHMQKKVKSTAKFMESFQKQLKPQTAMKSTKNSGSLRRID